MAVMPVIYLSGAAAACCVVWLVLSTGFGRKMPARSWRTALPPVIATSVALSTFFIARFVAVEAPVSAEVVVRGWLGLFAVFSAVFALAASLMLAGARRGGTDTGSR